MIWALLPIPWKFLAFQLKAHHRCFVMGKKIRGQEHVSQGEPKQSSDKMFDASQHHKTEEEASTTPL